MIMGLNKVQLDRKNSGSCGDKLVEMVVFVGSSIYIDYEKLDKNR